MRDDALEMRPLLCSVKSKDEHRMHGANRPETLPYGWCRAVCGEPSKDSRTLAHRANGNHKTHAREAWHRAPRHPPRIRSNKNAGESMSSPLSPEQRLPSKTVSPLDPRVFLRAAPTRRTPRNRE